MSNSPRPEPHTPAAPSYGGGGLADAELGRMLCRPIVLMTPERTVHPPSWLAHVPFAFWLIDVLRPRVFVELGTHAGNSYAAFAQAVQHLGLDAAGYAVDTWAGDPQAGFYDESVYTDWKAYHDQRYSAFSSLVRTTFDDAVGHFSDGSIDLLNLDGFHSRDAVRHDFETWLPKVSTRGVVLLHDINVRERDFGAWEVWSGIRATYPSFEFLHGHGLGVAVIGSEIAPELEWLVRRDEARTIAVRRFFARTGSGVLAQHMADRAGEMLRQHVSAVESGAVEALAAASAQHAAGLPALAALDARLRDQLRELMIGREALAAQLAESSQQLTETSQQLTERSQQLTETSQQLTAAAAAIDDLTRSLSDAETHAGEVERELTRAGAARAALETLLHRPDVAADAARGALAAANIRLRALAAKPPAARPRGSRPGRIAATLRALGFTPAQLSRRPRRLGLLLRWMRRPRLFKDAHLIAQSGLFDADYYLRLAPDISAAGANPLAHYVMRGALEGRAPSPLFDGAWYASQYPDVAAARINPLAHYLRTATREDRNPHALFSARYYRAQLGARGTAVTPLQHYVMHGAVEGLSPHPLFDPAYYAERCGPWFAGVDPFAHFLTEGAARNIDPHPLFDTAYYRTQLKTHERSAANPLRHYLEAGTGAGRRPHPLFDPAFYRRANADVAASGTEPLVHYVTAGGIEGRAPLPDFDGAWYLAMYPDVAETGVNPLVHYVRFGWLEGRNPSPHFDTKAYLARYPDVTRSGVNPYAHYLACGMAEGRTGAPDDVLDEPVRPVEPERVRLRTESLDRGAGAAQRVIVCLTHVMPVAPRAGNEYRIYRVLKWLRRSGYVVIPIVAPADGSQPGGDEARAIAEEFGNAIVCLPDGRLEYVLRDVPDILRSLDGTLTDRFAAILAEERTRTSDEREMLRIDRSFCSDALIATVLRLESALGPYVLLAEYIWMSRVLPLLGGRALKVIDTIDVFSTRHEKVGQFGVQDLVVEPAAEQMRLRRGDVAIAIQHNERQVLEALVPGVTIVTAGVDFEVLEEPSAPTGRHVLYVASDNPMNRHGLRDFLRHAWPLVRESVPDAELTVVGAVGASVPVVPPGVTVLGRVDDLAPLYRGCRVVINPAVAGTGIKIKTLEALSHLRRVVAWPNGVDGLSPAVEALCRTATDWYSFSEALIILLTDDAAAELNREERELLVREGSADVVYAELGRVIEEFFDTPPGGVSPALSSES